MCYAHEACESDQMQCHQAEVVGWGKLCLDAKTLHKKTWVLAFSAINVLSFLTFWLVENPFGLVIRYFHASFQALK